MKSRLYLSCEHSDLLEFFIRLSFFLLRPSAPEPIYRFTEGGNAVGAGDRRCEARDWRKFWEWMTGLGVERLALDPRFCFLCFLTLMDI